MTKVRPIIMRPELAQAAHEGCKTQTRRIGDRYAKWQVGDLLWVRETHAFVPPSAYRNSPGVVQTPDPKNNCCAVYLGGWERVKPGSWKPSIHMPRWASRTTLRITEICLEPLHSISEADAIAEGVSLVAARAGFAALWDRINGDGAWAKNPDVWKIKFERVCDEN